MCVLENLYCVMWQTRDLNLDVKIFSWLQYVFTRVYAMQNKTVIFVFFNGNRVLEGGVTEKGILMLKTDCMIKCYSQWWNS